MSTLYIFLITSFILASIYYSLTNNANNGRLSYHQNASSQQHEYLFPAEKVIHSVPETWIATHREGDNIDSLAFYRDFTSRNHDMKIIATAKNAHRFFVYDADEGRFEREIENVADMERPNGLTWMPQRPHLVPQLHQKGDPVSKKHARRWLLVTERDSRRVTLVTVPGFKILARFGEEELERPYATVVRARHYSTDSQDEEHQTSPPAEVYDIYVTDGFMDMKWNPKKKRKTHSGIPSNERLGARVKMYTMYVRNNKVERVEFVKSFGNTKGVGRLLRVESIMADEIYDHLVIADEEARDIKVYNFDGIFTGIRFGQGIFEKEPEGMALYECPESIKGFWITTDQRPELTHFHVFSRGSYRYMGSFAGNDTAHTDGVSLTQEAFGQFSEGAFVALHADASITAFSWSDIARTLNLQC